MAAASRNEAGHVCQYAERALARFPGTEPTVTDEDGTVWCSFCPTVLSASSPSVGES